MQSSIQEFYHSCHGRHPHPPFDLLFLLLLMLLFLYIIKFHFIWPFIVLMIFVFFVAMQRNRHTNHRGGFYNNNYQDYQVIVNSSYKNNQMIKSNYCKNCGTAIEQDSKYCSECGICLF